MAVVSYLSMVAILPALARANLAKIALLARRSSGRATVLPWRDAELGAKAADKIRQVVEADIEGNGRHLSAAAAQPLGGLTQTGSQQPLVWRDARDRLEGAQEVVGTHVCRTRQLGQGVWAIQGGTEPPNAANDCGMVPVRRLDRAVADGGLNDAARHLEGDLFERVVAANRRHRARRQGRVGAQRRHELTRQWEAGASGAVCQTGKDFGVKLER